MNSRPAIMILRVQSVMTDRMDPLLWGIEEEGVPFEVQAVTTAESVAELAKRAALNSALNVGIAVDERGEIALHHRDLPVGTPLFSLSGALGDPVKLRRLGVNAGRLAKVQPLVLNDDGKDR